MAGYFGRQELLQARDYANAVAADACKLNCLDPNNKNIFYFDDPQMPGNNDKAFQEQGHLHDSKGRSLVIGGAAMAIIGIAAAGTLIIIDYVIHRPLPRRYAHLPTNHAEVAPVPGENQSDAWSVTAPFKPSMSVAFPTELRF